MNDVAPRRRRGGWGEKIIAVSGVVVSLLYLTNLGAGIIELLPDNLPVVGNLDEGFFAVLLLASLRRLGIDLLPFVRSQRSSAELRDDRARD